MFFLKFSGNFVECVIDKKNLKCREHDCAIKCVNVSSKKWQWIENKKQFGNVSKKTKKYICPVRSKMLVSEPMTPEPESESIILGNINLRTQTGEFLEHSEGLD